MERCLKHIQWGKELKKRMYGKIPFLKKKSYVCYSAYLFINRKQLEKYTLKCPVISEEWEYFFTFYIILPIFEFLN